MKIKVKNNWEYLTYFFNGKKIDEKKGGKVLLVNGNIVKYKSVATDVSYIDMGRRYSLTQYKLIAIISYDNQNIEVGLEQLDIKKFIKN